MQKEDIKFLKLLDDMIKRRINKYPHLKDDEDWKGHWDKVYQEIAGQYYQEKNGERQRFFTILGDMAININLKKREASFFKERRLRAALIRTHACDYIVQKKEQEDDKYGFCYHEYDYAKDGGSGKFLEKSSVSYDLLPEDQYHEKEIYEIALDMIKELKTVEDNGEEYAYIAEHLLLVTEKDHGQHGIISEMAKHLQETSESVRNKKHKMKKEMEKIVSKTGLDLEAVKKSMATKRKHADEMKRCTVDEVAGIYIPEPITAKVASTHIWSINQLMDDEIREFEKLYCWNALGGKQAGLDKQIDKAITDRPKASRKRGSKTGTKKPTRNKSSHTTKKSSSDDAA